MSYNKFRDNYDWTMMNFSIHKINFLIDLFEKNLLNNDKKL